MYIHIYIHSKISIASFSTIVEYASPSGSPLFAGERILQFLGLWIGPGRYISFDVSFDHQTWFKHEISWVRLLFVNVCYFSLLGKTTPVRFMVDIDLHRASTRSFKPFSVWSSPPYWMARNSSWIEILAIKGLVENLRMIWTCLDIKRMVIQNG